MAVIIINSPKYGPHTAVIDDEDFVRVSKFKWSLQVRRDCPHLRYAVNRHQTYLHRFVLGIDKGKNVEAKVDHVDGNGLNCLKSNLRLCSIKNNQRNKKTSANSTTGFKGVYERKCGKYPNRPFTARIMVMGKRLEIGAYATAKLAAEAYNKAALLHYGEFSRLNKIV